MSQINEKDEAKEWWENRPFEIQFIDCIRNFGYDQQPGLLSSEQIEKIYLNHLKERNA